MTGGDWVAAVRSGRGQQLRDGRYEQVRLLISCVPECSNAGPYLVVTPPGDNFFCSSCGRQMEQRDAEEQP